MRVRPGVVVGGLAVLVLLVFLFRPGPDGRSLPPASNPTTSPPAESTTTRDLFAVPLPELAGQTTLPPLRQDGRARLVGYVSSPEGPLGGATVRVERLVGSRSRQIDVATSEDGRFTLEGVPGGRYRVRAFQAPKYTVAEPVVFFIADGAERQIELRASDVSGVSVQAGTTPAEPYLGQGVNLAVRVADIAVDGNGIAGESPRENALVRISSTGWLPIDPDAARRTGPDGVAVFAFSCERVTSVSATAVIGPEDGEQELFTLDVPPCAPVPTTTTTSTTTSSTPDPDDGPPTTG